jgi:hypothetical protein
LAIGSHPPHPNQQTVSPWESVAGGGPTQTSRHAAPQQACHAAPNQAPPPPTSGLRFCPRRLEQGPPSAGCKRKTLPSAAAYHPKVMTQSAPLPPHQAAPINPYRCASPHPTIVNHPDMCWAPQTGRRNLKTKPSTAAYHPTAANNQYLCASHPTEANHVGAPPSGGRNRHTVGAHIYENHARPLSNPFASMSTEELERRWRLELENPHGNKRLCARPIQPCLNPTPPCMPPQGCDENYDVMLPLDLNVLDDDAQRVSETS